MVLFLHFYSFLKMNKPQKASDMVTVDRVSTLNRFEMGV